MMFLSGRHGIRFPVCLCGGPPWRISKTDMWPDSQRSTTDSRPMWREGWDCQGRCCPCAAPLPWNAHGLRRRIATGKWSIRASGEQTKDDRHNPVRNHVSDCRHAFILWFSREDRVFISTVFLGETKYHVKCAVMFISFITVFISFQSEAAGYSVRGMSFLTLSTRVWVIWGASCCLRLFFFSSSFFLFFFIVLIFCERPNPSPTSKWRDERRVWREEVVAPPRDAAHSCHCCVQ